MEAPFPIKWRRHSRLNGGAIPYSIQTPFPIQFRRHPQLINGAHHDSLSAPSSIHYRRPSLSIIGAHLDSLSAPIPIHYRRPHLDSLPAPTPRFITGAHTSILHRRLSQLFTRASVTIPGAHRQLILSVSVSVENIVRSSAISCERSHPAKVLSLIFDIHDDEQILAQLHNGEKNKLNNELYRFL